MRQASDSLTSIVSYLELLDPNAVKVAMARWERGGHRPASMSSGRGGGETPMPVGERDFEVREDGRVVAILTDQIGPPDAHDHQMRNLDLEYRAMLEGVLESVKQSVRLQDRIVAGRIVDTSVNNPEAQDTRLKWCRSCMRVSRNGTPYLTVVADEKKGGKDCILCRWCLDRQRDDPEHKWPDIERVRRRADGLPDRVKLKP